MRQALDNGTALPSALLNESAYPGGVVAMVSPALRDADAAIEVFVEGMPSPHVMRAILGYATFEVPVSLTGQDAEVEVVIEADGTVVERLPMLLKRSPDIPAASAKEDVLGFLAELAGLITGQQQAGADFIEQNGGLSADDTAIVLGVADAAAQQLEAATAELEVLLDGEGGEELATILQAALYANGLVEFRERTEAASRSAEARKAGSPAANSVRDVRDVCDEYVPVICALKRIDTGLSFGSTVAMALCTASGLASALALVPTGGSSGILFVYVVKFCTPAMVALEIATTISSLIEGITLDMRLTTDKDVLTKTGDTATITAEVTFFGLLSLCHKESTANVSERFAGGINKRIVKLLMKTSKRLRLVKQIVAKLGKSQTAFFFMVIENVVGYALTRGRIDLAFQAAADKMCGYFDADTTAQEKLVGIPADGKEFNLVAYAGTQRLSKNEFDATDDGGGAYSGTYSLSCPAGFSGTLVVEGSKSLCDEERDDSLRITCSTGCIGAPSDRVHIPDENLRWEIFDEIGFPITRDSLSRMESLYAPEGEIHSLMGLECATGLRSATLDYNEISDLTPLSGLTTLEELSLQNNNISDLSPLSGLTSLTELTLSYNGISDLSPLSGLTSLKRLNLNENRISNVSPLSGLTALESLLLRGNQISDLSPLPGRGESPLSDLTSLEELRLNENRISSMSLSGLTALRVLWLWDSQLTSVSSLSGLTALEKLLLHRNRISDLSSLSGLTALKELNLRNNQISDTGPLVSNPGLGEGDEVSLRWNPLNEVSCLVHLPALMRRGVHIEPLYLYDCRAYY